MGSLAQASIWKSRGTSAAGGHRYRIIQIELTTRNKKLLGAPGIATRSKDATRGSWPYYYEQRSYILGT